MGQKRFAPRLVAHQHPQLAAAGDDRRLVEYERPGLNFRREPANFVDVHIQGRGNHHGPRQGRRRKGDQIGTQVEVPPQLQAGQPDRPDPGRARRQDVAGLEAQQAVGVCIDEGGVEARDCDRVRRPAHQVTLSQHAQPSEQPCVHIAGEGGLPGGRQQRGVIVDRRARRIRTFALAALAALVGMTAVHGIGNLGAHGRDDCHRGGPWVQFRPDSRQPRKVHQVVRPNARRGPQTHLANGVGGHQQRAVFLHELIDRARIHPIDGHPRQDRTLAHLCEREGQRRRLTGLGHGGGHDRAVDRLGDGRSGKQAQSHHQRHAIGERRDGPDRSWIGGVLDHALICRIKSFDLPGFLLRPRRTRDGLFQLSR